MTGAVLLRDVMESDLPVFFEQQLDPEANRMAAFPARDRDAFNAHWAKILADGSITKKSILLDGQVAGNIVSFEQSGKPLVGYWIGRKYWGKGVATQALSAFLVHVKMRPLYAHVEKHNIASIGEFTLRLGTNEREVLMPTVERLIPILVYDDIPAAHDFLVEAFGFTSGGIERDSEDQPVHAEVRAGDFVIWLHRVAAELNLASPRALPAASSGLVIHVDDVNAHYERARARGADIESEPQDMPYGQREYGVRDVEGHRWWFAAPLR